MNLICQKSTDVNDNILKAFVSSFNEQFETSYTLEYFHQKYFTTPTGFSFHAFGIENNKVVAACNVVPYEYEIDNSMELIGLMTDIFVLEGNRKDPMLLFRLVNMVENIMIDNNVNFVHAVPNDKSFPYLTKMCGWSEIGALNYYVLPIKIGNVISKFKLLNIGSRLVSRILLLVDNVFFGRARHQEFNYQINRANEIFHLNRYYNWHKKISLSNGGTSWLRIIIEDGIKACYIIDFYNQEMKSDAATLNDTIKYILKNEDVDIILYIGKLSFKRISLIKVPEKYEPKKLNYCGKILSVNNSDHNNGFYDLDNWNFGLMNYDVR